MSRPIRITILIIAAVVFVYSGSQLIWNFYQMSVGSSAYEEIREEVIIEIPEPEIPEEIEGPTLTFTVDFEALQNINNEIIAWIYIPDTPVSYPVLHGSDNQKYLNTTFDKRNNILGSIFIDFRNSGEFENLNTIIYGHNTTNDSMFGSLKRFLEQSYADERPEIIILREGEIRVYEIFSVFETPATSDAYTISFSSAESFEEYIQRMAAQSVVQMGSPPLTEPIITLSTCTPNNRDMRLVIQAKLSGLFESQ